MIIVNYLPIMFNLTPIIKRKTGYSFHDLKSPSFYYRFMFRKYLGKMGKVLMISFISQFKVLPVMRIPAWWFKPHMEEEIAFKVFMRRTVFPYFFFFPG